MEMMQQPRLVGYRQLNEADAMLINEVKMVGGDLAMLVNTLRGMVGVDPRWVSIGETHLQQGLMALTRAIAQPESF